MTDEEYREVEEELTTRGYINDKEWNEMRLECKVYPKVVEVNEDGKFTLFLLDGWEDEKFQSLEEFKNKYKQ